MTLLHLMQATNVFRKQYKIHVKGSNVAAPLQVLADRKDCTGSSSCVWHV